MATVKYCPRCDLAFCPEHEAEHFPSCQGAPTEESARRYGAGWCSVCAGILKPGRASE